MNWNMCDLLFSLVDAVFSPIAHRWQHSAYHNSLQMHYFLVLVLRRYVVH
jgi:hypothetical protein